MNRVSLACCAATISLATVSADLTVSGTSRASNRGETVGADKYTYAKAGVTAEFVVRSTRIEPTPAPFIPRTKLGKALWAARQEIVASGEQLVEGRLLLEELSASRG